VDYADAYCVAVLAVVAHEERMPLRTALSRGRQQVLVSALRVAGGEIVDDGSVVPRRRALAVRMARALEQRVPRLTPLLSTSLGALSVAVGEAARLFESLPLHSDALRIGRAVMRRLEAEAATEDRPARGGRDLDDVRAGIRFLGVLGAERDLGLLRPRRRSRRSTGSVEPPDPDGSGSIRSAMHRPHRRDLGDGLSAPS
jgi:hypothetical protein